MQREEQTGLSKTVQKKSVAVDLYRLAFVSSVPYQDTKGIQFLLRTSVTRGTSIYNTYQRQDNFSHFFISSFVFRERPFITAGCV